MKYKLFGRTGLRVSELCLGTMTFGPEFGWGAEKDESRRIFDTFVEAGGNFIDTANHYTAGTSERYVGEFIKSERHRYVVATKYTLTPRPKDPNARPTISMILGFAQQNVTGYSVPVAIPS